MHYVIIGNGVAGINAANTIRNRDSEATISIISYESDHFFSRTALMYVFCGQLSSRCIEPYERDYYKRMNFTRYRQRVTTINAEAHELLFESGDKLTYDKLLIACGSVGRALECRGSDLDGVGCFVTLPDLEWLKEKADKASSAVVAGGGLIGVEVAEILLKAGIRVSFLMRDNYFWPTALDEQEGMIAVEHMQKHGCAVHLNTELKEIIGESRKVIGVRTSNGDRIDCDLVALTIGVRPQTDWLSESNIDRDASGGIVVDELLATKQPNIWAAGDCTSVTWFNNVQRPEQLWYTSRDQGIAAGLNMLGDKKPYHRETFYNSAKLFDIEYTTAGLVNFGVDGEQNFFYREQGSNNTVRVVYLPDNSVIGFNMLGRRWDHSVLVRWIEEQRQLDWVLEHLREANFDEELMPKFKPIKRQA